MQSTIAPVPKALRRFQPQLSYFLIDEQRLTKEVFEQVPELLGNMLSLNQMQNAEDDIALWEALKKKSKSHPGFELLSVTINQWCFPSLQPNDTPTGFCFRGFCCVHGGLTP